MTTPRSPQMAAFLRQATANPRPTRPDDLDRLRARAQGADTVTTPATPDEHPRKPSPPPGGWPTGGTQVAGFHLCTPCGDSIYPGEHVYDNGDGNVRCAVCEIKHRTAADDPAAAEQALRDRLEHAIRARLAKAWPPLDSPAQNNWLDQVAAVAAAAAVEELAQS